MSLQSSKKTRFIVQPFWKRGLSLQAGQHRLASDRSDAIVKARGLMEGAAGVAVLAVEVAEDVDYCGEPAVIATFGETPEP